MLSRGKKIKKGKSKALETVKKNPVLCRSGFLNVGTADVGGWDNLWCWGLCVHYEMFSCIPGLYPLDANSTLHPSFANPAKCPLMGTPPTLLSPDPLRFTAVGYCPFVPTCNASKRQYSPSRFSLCLMGKGGKQQ